MPAKVTVTTLVLSRLSIARQVGPLKKLRSQLIRLLSFPGGPVKLSFAIVNTLFVFL